MTPTMTLANKNHIDLVNSFSLCSSFLLCNSLISNGSLSTCAIILAICSTVNGLSL